MAFSRGRIAHDVVRNTAVGDFVLAPLHVRRRDRGHRLDALDVHLQELLHESEDRVELALEVLNLVLRNRDAGEMRDAADSSSVDRHWSAQRRETSAASISKRPIPLRPKIDNSYKLYHT